jgi:CDGSH-type Zn-finger protein
VDALGRDAAVAELFRGNHAALTVGDGADLDVRGGLISHSKTYPPRARSSPPGPSGKFRSVDDETTITPYRDGPLLVRGPFRLVDQDGNAIANDREIVALCRCGKSRIRPFCDGSHKLVRFKAPSGAERGRDAG